MLQHGGKPFTPLCAQQIVVAFAVLHTDRGQRWGLNVPAVSWLSAQAHHGKATRLSQGLSMRIAVLLPVVCVLQEFTVNPKP
jgi:hypothetical protein